MSWVGNYIPTRTPFISPLTTPEAVTLAVTGGELRGGGAWGLVVGLLLLAAIVAVRGRAVRRE